MTAGVEATRASIGRCVKCETFTELGDGYCVDCWDSRRPRKAKKKAGRGPGRPKGSKDSYNRRRA